MSRRFSSAPGLGCLALLVLGCMTNQSCAARGNADPIRTTQGNATTAADASAGSATTKMGPVGLASPGTACAADGAHACWKNGSKLALICKANAWEVETICDDNQRCDSAPGDQQGRCMPIVAECENQQPGEAFCADDVVRRCTDLVSFTDTPCGDAETCGVGVVAGCSCKAGYTGMAGACVDIDECKVNGGGCDEGAPCRNTNGSYTCGQCPAGYIGGGSDCTPALTSLVASPAGMKPEFTAVATEYNLSIPITTTTIALKPTAPEKASIAIDGNEVKQKRTWRSNPLPPGKTDMAIVVSEGKRERKYTLHITRGTGDSTYLKAPNADANDNFGASIAISGDTMVIGAPGEDSNGTGVHTPKDMAESAANNAAQSAGAAYVFVREGAVWSLQAYLKAGNAAAGALFGATVAIAGDTIVVGAPGEATAVTDPATTAYASGAAYVFTLRRNKWTQRAYLKASNAGAGDMFGSAVAISGDTIVVGAPGEASSVTGVNGAPDNNGALGSGAAYVFVRQDDRWLQHTYLKSDRTRSGDTFGCAVAISDDTIIIGATGEDSGANSVNGDPESDAADNSGAAYAFVRDEDAWYQDAYFKGSLNAAGDSFGFSVAVAGDTAVVGAPGSSRGNGAAYVFAREGGLWSQQVPLVNAPRIGEPSGPGDAFGASVRIVDESVLIGAYGDDSDGVGWNDMRANINAPNSGAAYLLSHKRDFWMQSDFIKPTNTRPNEQFGSRSAISRDTIAIGAMNDGRNPRDMMPMGDLGPPNSGSVSVFR